MDVGASGFLPWMKKKKKELRAVTDISFHIRSLNPKTNPSSVRDRQFIFIFMFILTESHLQPGVISIFLLVFEIQTWVLLT